MIGDLVGSRDAPDRAALQDSLRAALHLANEHCAPTEPLTPTIGDEVQGVFDNISAAVDATLFVRVSLPAPYDIRFGIGIGAVSWVEDEPVGGFRRQDGQAWWTARDAIDHVALAATRRDVPATLRTWMAAVPADVSPQVRVIADVELHEDPRIAALDAYLVMRDHVVTRMDARDRRILQRLLLGRHLYEIAEAEGITPSAVSQRVQRSGAASLMYSREIMLRFLAREDGSTSRNGGATE